jgi:hypothetical protein
MKRPAYARSLSEQISTGQFVRLVVLSLHDWSAGKMLCDRPGVVRLVIGPDLPLVDLDLSQLFGLDVLVIGSAEHADLDALQRLALASGAATCWGEYVDGLWRVVPCGRRGLLAVDRVADADELLDRLPALRLAQLLKGEGVFQSPTFRDARLSAMGAVFGPTVEARLRERMAA